MNSFILFINLSHVNRGLYILWRLDFIFHFPNKLKDLNILLKEEEEKGTKNILFNLLACLRIYIFFSFFFWLLKYVQA